MAFNFELFYSFLACLHAIFNYKNIPLSPFKNKIQFSTLKIVKKMIMNCILNMDQFQYEFSKQKLKRGIQRMKSQRELQIIKKLKTVKTKIELKKVLNDIEDQNQKLLSQVKNLRNKVQLLLEKHKLKNANKTTQQIKVKAEIDKIKQQLVIKYRNMQNLKKQVQDSQTMTDEVKNSETERKNKIIKLDNEISQIKIKQRDLKKQGKHLQQSVKEIQKDLTQVNPKIPELQSQNAQLRKKIFELRRHSQQNLYQSVKVQQNLTKVRGHYRQNVKITLNDLKGLQTPNKNELLNKQMQLKRQIEQLKEQVESVQLKNHKKQIQTKRQRQKHMNDNKLQMEKLRSVETHKIKLQTQLNKYRILWRKILVNKQKKIKTPQFVEKSSQVSLYQDLQPLRRDFVGTLGKYRFDDRIILRNQKKTFITGIISYENQKGSLAAVKCIYSNAKTTQIDYPPSLENYLSKCKTQKIQIQLDDFVKVIKVKALNDEFQGRVLKIEVLSNKNLKYQLGEKRIFSDVNQSEVVYAFDISVQQFPVSIFGSFSYIKNHWYLESFGVQINDL